jgi:hypothetical protein
LTDSFEGGNPRWKLVDWDCDAKIRLQEISPQLPHSGLTCEVIELRMGRGTLAVLGYPIRPALVLEEFKPSLWIRSTQRGATLGVRVVFRNALHPVTGKPREIWIWGDSYGAVGSWQRVQLTGLPQRLGEKVRALRSEFGNEVDWSEAVVDYVAVNGYSNSGTQVLQLDDLEVSGLIEAPRQDRAAPSASGLDPTMNADPDPQSPGRLASSSSDSGSNLDERPTIAKADDLGVGTLVTNRWLQYQGESLEWLASIGIKGIILSSAPTHKELEQAEQYGIKVISPLPTIVPLQEQSKAWSVVEGWTVGDYVDREEYEAMRRRVEQMRSSMNYLQKPIVVEPIENLWRYSRISNTLILPCLQAGAYERSVELTEFLENALRDCRGTPQVMASLATQPSLEWRRQIDSFGEVIGQPTVNMTIGDPSQIRTQMYRTLAAGIQGIYFRSRSPLDAESNEDRARANMLQWIHAELDLISPWLNSTRGSRNRVQSSDSHWDATLWETPKSQLLVVQPAGTVSHLSFANRTHQPLKLSWQQISPSSQVMRFTRWKLETLPQRRIGGMVEVQIDNPHTIEFLVSTSEPQVLSYFNQRFEVLGAAYAFAVANVAQMRLAAAQEIVTARWQIVANNRLTEDMLAIQRASRDMEQAYVLLGNNTPEAMAYILRALEASHQVIHNAWSVARADVPSPQSAPWLLASSSVPLHWYVGQQIGANSWSDLGLAGGGLENLDVMLAAGWKQDRRLEDQVEVLTEIVPLDEGRGGNALRIVARGREREVSGGYAGSSLRIRSGAIHVTAGQIIRIEGKVMIRGGCSKPQSGVLIYESNEGPVLGQLLCSPHGSWLPLRMYRVIDRTGPLEIMIEMRGEGDVLIDEITVAAANLTPPDANKVPPSLPINP